MNLKKMEVVSKFRTGYWIRQIIIYVGSLILIGFCAYVSFDKGQLDYKNILCIFACLGVFVFIFHFIYFLLNELKQVTVRDNEIIIKYLINSSSTTISYSEIQNITSKRITQRRGASITTGFLETEISLSNGQLLSFNEDQFENYDEIKNRILLGIK